MPHPLRPLVAIALVLAACVLSPSVAAAGDGRGATHVHETPNAPAGAGEPVVSLTFDDGPHPEYTPQILDILGRYGAKATFFVLGSSAERHPELVQRLVAEGHVVANHTWGHPDLRGLSEDQFAWEVDHTTQVLEAISGQRVSCLRPPKGRADASVMQRLAARALTSVVWTADSRDFSKPGVDAVVAGALLGLQPGGVILLHDGGGNRDQTIAALPRIIEGIQAAGYRIAPICGPGPRNHVPIGHVDGASGQRGRIKVAGWALDPDLPDPIDVHVFVDGTLAGVAQADRSRADLAAANLGDAHGFSAVVRGQPGSRRVCVHGINIGTANGNPEVGCTTVEVPPLTAMDDIRPFVARLRWTQILEQVDVVAAVSQVHAARRAPWQLTLTRSGPDA